MRPGKAATPTIRRPSGAGTVTKGRPAPVAPAISQSPPRPSRSPAIAAGRRLPPPPRAHNAPRYRIPPRLGAPSRGRVQEHAPAQAFKETVARGVEYTPRARFIPARAPASAASAPCRPARNSANGVSLRSASGHWRDRHTQCRTGQGGSGACASWRSARRRQTRPYRRWAWPGSQRGLGRLRRGALAGARVDARHHGARPVRRAGPGHLGRRRDRRRHRSWRIPACHRQPARLGRASARWAPDRSRPTTWTSTSCAASLSNTSGVTASCRKPTAWRRPSICPLVFNIDHTNAMAPATPPATFLAAQPNRHCHVTRDKHEARRAPEPARRWPLP